MPLSETVKTSRTFPRAAVSLAAARRTLPRPVNFTALSIRFSSAARSRNGSPITASGKSLDRSTSAAIPLASARAASEAASASAKRRGRMSSRRSTRPLTSARAASTMSEVSSARCSAVLLIAAAQPRSRSPSPDVVSSSPRARMPVSGVLISCAISASVASIARVRDAAERGRAARLPRRVPRRLPADVFLLGIAPPKGDCHGAPPPATGSHASPTIRRMSAAVAPRSRSARKAVARVDLDSFFPSASRIRR